MSAENEQARVSAQPALTPGRAIFLVVHKDPLRERIDVRASRVVRLDADVLVLEQSTPPLVHDASDANLEVAVLEPDKDGGLRPIGYLARLLDVLPAYPVDDGEHISALAVTAPGPGDYFETSLRMHYRVPVEEHMGVFMRLADPTAASGATVGPDGAVSPMTGMEQAIIEGVRLLDFSAGGARISVVSHTGVDARFDVGNKLPFRLIFVGSGFAEGIAVVRSIDRETAPEGTGLLCLGLQFTNMEIRDIRYMERMVARTVSACRQRERDASYT